MNYNPPKSSLLKSKKNQNQNQNKDSISIPKKSINNKYNKTNSKHKSINELRNSSLSYENSKDKKISFINDKYSQSNSNNNNKNNNKEIISQLPYLTIDCIFNKQNTWINLQNQEDPLKIMYDIWDKKLWYPLNYYNDDESESDKKKENSEKSNYNTLINMEDIPAFFSFKDLIKPFTEEKLKTIQKNINDILKDSIKSLRKLENKKTKFANVII
jgi:hypothetical protein